MLSTVWIPLLLFGCAVLFMVRRRRLISRGVPLPPGPRRIPVLGNVLDFPRFHYGEKLARLAERHGDIMYLELLTQPAVILSSYNAAVDLLEKRSANYSDRARSIMADLTGYSDWVSVLMPYGRKWRWHRRAILQSFHPEALERAKPILMETTRDLLRDLLGSPQDFSQHVSFAVAQSMMRIVYGIHLTDRNDQYFHMAETIVEVGSRMSTPGSFLVEICPPLQYVPSWLPGTSFTGKRLAAIWRAQTRAYRDTLFEAGKAALYDRGVVEPLISKVLKTNNEFVPATVSLSETEEVCRGAAATAYAGGADTTHAAIHVFLFAMASHPEAQTRAQAELDSIVGRDRLPGLHDRDSLPYLNALVKEVLRWHVISPIGVPHRSIEEDVYDGYLIPAGSLIIPNQWAMSRDESEYPEPDRFSPERFLKDGKLDPNVRDPAAFLFGFGRRICPGLHFVDTSLFITFASLLHVFRILPPLDDSGAPLPMKFTYAGTSLTARPEEFGCTIITRSTSAAELVYAPFEEIS
ncbi:cytochrome P450 [Trametes meyenii]|nr:cytochrome P450 [Trametes meyenii]